MLTRELLNELKCKEVQEKKKRGKGWTERKVYRNGTLKQKTQEGRTPRGTNTREAFSKTKGLNRCGKKRMGKIHHVAKTIIFNVKKCFIALSGLLIVVLQWVFGNTWSLPPPPPKPQGWWSLPHCFASSP